MKQMETEIAQAKAAGIERTIPDYDNSAVLLPQLYQIMDSTISTRLVLMGSRPRQYRAETCADRV